MKLNMIRRCPMCGEEHAMLVDSADIHRYLECQHNVPIQEVLKDYNPMEREFIMNGYCKQCQNDIFGTDYKSDKFVY